VAVKKKSFKSLIRLTGQKLDEERQLLGDLQAELMRAMQRVDDLDREIVAERQVAEQGDLLVQQAFMGYAEQAKKRRSELMAELAALAVKVEQQRAKVQAAHQEKRKFEMAEEQRLEKIKEEIERKEEIAQDELALNLFRRRQRLEAEQDEMI